MTATIQQVVADFDIMLADHDPYVFGGISFYTGADCSGWIYESLVTQGVKNPPRTSQAQFAAWKPAPGPGYGIAVFFNVPADGTRPGDQPGHVALCLGTGTMAEEPHTGLDAEIAPIPNIPGVESIMGYRYLPVSYGTPNPPPVPTPTVNETEKNMLTKDSKSGGYWGARANGSVYTFDGAPYIGPLAKYTAEWGIGTAANPVVGIAADGEGGFALLTDNGGPQPEIYNIPANGQFAK